MKRKLLITTMVLGVWLIVAPFVLGYSEWFLMTANDVILGVLLIASSWWSLKAVVPALSVWGLQALCSLWLIVVPFAFAYAPWSRAMIGDVVVGIIALAITMIDFWTIVAPPVKTA